MTCRKHIKGCVAVVLVLLMSISCAACRIPKNDMEACSDTSADMAYRVRVVDEEGAPMGGVTVQICSHVCQMGRTNAEGVAIFAVEPGAYKASVTVMPEGYTYASEQTEFLLEEESREMTIVLKRISPEAS